MRKRIVAATLSSVLALTSLFGLGAGAQAEPTSYLLAYKSEQLPADYEAMVAKAGGQVQRVIAEVGIVQATSNQPGFLQVIRQIEGIHAADKEWEVYLDVEPQAADGNPVELPKPEWDNPEQNYHDLQWDMKKLTHNFESHQINKGSKDVVVAVVDTGIDFNHPDLKENVDEAGSKTFVPGTTNAWDYNGHGTHVAGSIAANGKVLGVAPNVTVRSYRVFGATGGAMQSWITDAIVAAANDGVDVINMSLGGWRWMAHNLGEKGDSASMVAYHRAVQYAVKRGTAVVVAAGNDSRNLNDIHDMQSYWKERYGIDIKGPSRVAPAQIPGVITVSSSNGWSNDSIAFYSNYGNEIDVAAPGGDNGPVYDELYREDKTGNHLHARDFMHRTLSTYPTYLSKGTAATLYDFTNTNIEGYAYYHGTSMAAPKAAGVAALIKSIHPEYNPSQVAAALRQTAVDHGKVGVDPLFGAGEVNAYNVVKGKK